MPRTNSTPLNELSLRRPTNGEMYVAPAIPAIAACATEKQRVTLVFTPTSLKYLHALIPSFVIGNLIVTASLMSRYFAASSIISAAVSPLTSADILSISGNISAISCINSR